MILTYYFTFFKDMQMNNFKNHIFDEFSLDLWDYLKAVKKPILIYGMGNGADKIISVLSSYGIEYADVFASDEFVRGHSFHGKVVLSYSQAREKYADFIILLSFGTHLPDVMERIYELNEIHELYAPDVPVCQGEIFTSAFFEKNASSLEMARNSLYDEKSRLIFDDIIRFKLTGRIKYLESTEVQEKEINTFLSYDNYEKILDLGAYNGDTAKKFIGLCSNLKEIHAFEPDFRNFKKLNAFASEQDFPKVFAYNYASWDTDTTLQFSASGNRNSSGIGTPSHQTKLVEILAKRPDGVIDSVDFIKYDVEGAEYKAITGSRRLIEESSPDLLVSMYHRSEDLYELPLLIKNLNPKYKLILRRLPCIPAWDLNLYAIS